VKINKELESQLLSFGEDLEVLAPADFRNHIAEKTKLMNQKYSDK
jgi:predicted DNA-binding transcriptional regulator YafY